MSTNLATKNRNVNPVAEKSTGNPSAEDISEAAPQSLSKQNLEAIELFFMCYGDETRSEFSHFFFDLLVHFVNNDRDRGYSDKYKDDFMLKVGILKDLAMSLELPPL